MAAYDEEDDGGKVPKAGAADAPKDAAPADGAKGPEGESGGGDTPGGAPGDGGYPVPPQPGDPGYEDWLQKHPDGAPGDGAPPPDAPN